VNGGFSTSLDSVTQSADCKRVNLFSGRGRLLLYDVAEQSVKLFDPGVLPTTILVSPKKAKHGKQRNTIL